MKKTYGILVVGLMGFALCASGLETLVKTTNSHGRLTWSADTMFTNQNEIIGFIQDDSRMTVARGATDIASWEALTNGYQSAKLLTPGGNSLSQTNRATLILPPGIYDAEGNTLTLDANYVDIVAMYPEVSMAAHRDYTLTHAGIGFPGWTNGVAFVFPKTRVVGEQPNDVIQYSVFEQTVEDTRLTGFSLEASSFTNLSYTVNPHHSGLYVTAPEGGQNSRYEKMTFWAQRVTGGDSMSGTFPTLHKYHFDGDWVDCVGNDSCFRLYRNYPFGHTGTNQYFRASMINCHAGSHSFGGDSESGSIVGSYFDGCTAVGGSFSGCTLYAMPIDSTTTFVDCHAPFGSSFGLQNLCEATLIRCTGGPACAGGSFYTINENLGRFAGYAEDCDFGQGSFGGIATKVDGTVSSATTNNFCSGTLVRCTVRDNVSELQLKGATIRDSYFVSSTNVFYTYGYVEVIGGVTNNTYVSDDLIIPVDPPWYYVGPITNSTSESQFLLLDSDSVLFDSVFEVDPSGTGTVVIASTTQSVVFMNNTFNNRDVAGSGLGSNVTAKTDNWANPIGDVVVDVDFKSNSIASISSVTFTNGGAISDAGSTFSFETSDIMLLESGVGGIQFNPIGTNQVLFGNGATFKSTTFTSDADFDGNDITDILSIYGTNGFVLSFFSDQARLYNSGFTESVAVHDSGLIEIDGTTIEVGDTDTDAIGFYSATPVARQSITTNAQDSIINLSDDLQDLIQALHSMGIIEAQ